MRLGGFCPLPFSLGGEAPRIEALYEAQNQALGSAYDTADFTTVTAETMAEARALDDVYESNTRMSYASDPSRMPEELIPRWEVVFDLHPHRTDSLETRRSMLSAKFLALSGGTLLEDTVRAITGASFVGIEFHPLSTAVVRWSVNSFPDRWTSSVAHVLIRVQFAANQTNAAFWNMLATLSKFLQDFLPAWMEFDAAIHDSGGGDCFLLDEPNLDLESLCA